MAQITLPNGQRRGKSGQTKREVTDWLLEERSKIRRGIFPVDEKITLGQYLDNFIADVATHTLRPSTLRSYSYLIHDHIQPELGHIKLVALRPDQIQLLYTIKLEQGLSRRTVQYIHSVLRRALNQALKWGLIYRNPTDAVAPPKPGKQEPKTLTAKQVKQFFDQVAEHQYYPIYVMAVTMGLRKSEILGLRWQDVGFEQGTVSINHIVTEVQGVITWGSPKTDSSRRTLSMPQVVQDALWDLQANSGKAEGLVFTTASGQPISQRNLTRHFHAALEKAGLERMRFHDLRHTAATLLLKENVHPKVVQEMLGHSSISLTLDTYSHVVPGIRKQAAQKMDKLFG